MNINVLRALVHIVFKFDLDVLKTGPSPLKNYINVSKCKSFLYTCTVLSAKSDSHVVFCLHLLSKTLTCTLHLS